jgi:hypothetical protein
LIKSRRIHSRNAAAPLLNCASFITTLILLLPSLGSAAGQRIHLNPNFTMGQTFRYHFESRTTTTGTTTTPIVDPEAASKLKQTSDLLIRLDVVGVEPAANGVPGAARLRATYEKASASTETDSYDPAATSLADIYNNMQGRSLEFTIESNGTISHLTGLDDVLSNPSAAGAVRGWLDGFSPRGNLPAEGIAIGQKWNAESPLNNTPLANLLRRTEFAYLRDERCEIPIAPGSSARDGGTSATKDPAAGSTSTGPFCAVILARFEILRHGSGDPTPEDYRHNGLRSSGTWTGKGESLDSISLQTGMLVRSTQTSTQKMDIEITSALSGSKMHYAGQVETQSEITLLPSTSAAP